MPEKNDINVLEFETEITFVDTPERIKIRMWSDKKCVNEVKRLADKDRIFPEEAQALIEVLKGSIKRQEEKNISKKQLPLPLPEERISFSK